jgi:thiamine biosynthesis lipoprotein ApbE
MMVPDERSLAYHKPSDLFVELVLEAWNFRDLSPSTHNPSYCSFVDAWTFHFSTFYTRPLFPLLSPVPFF